MLTGRARAFYVDDMQGKEMTFKDLTAAIKIRFITADYKLSFVREWNNVFLNTIIAENFVKMQKH